MKKRKGIMAAACLLGLLILTALDQWTKQLAVKYLQDQEAYPILKGIFELQYLENRGAAFGMLQGQQTFFLLIALAVFAGVVYCLAKLPAEGKFLPARMTLTLISAGAAGNLIDRMGQHYVVDFLYFKLIDFPIFNVADCYVCVGTGLLLLLILFYYRDEDLECLRLHRGSGKRDITE